MNLRLPWPHANAFFDREIQRILQAHPKPEQALRLFLEIDRFASSRESAKAHPEHFLQSYIEAPEFAAELLLELTRFHQRPPEARSWGQKLAPFNTPKVREVRLADGSKTIVRRNRARSGRKIAEAVGGEATDGVITIEASRERKRREAILRKWERFAVFVDESSPTPPGA